MRIIYLFLSLLPFIGSKVYAIDTSMQTVKKECASCVTDVQFMNSAIAGLRNGYYTIYVSNLHTAVVKKIYYKNLVSYDRNGDPVYSKEKYFEPVEANMLTAIKKYSTSRKSMDYLLSKTTIPSFIAESAYDVVIDHTKVNMIEAFVSQQDGFWDHVVSLAQAMLVLTNMPPTIEVMMNDGSRLIFRVKDVTLNTQRFTLVIERAIDKSGNSIPKDKASYMNMGVVQFGPNAEGDMDKLIHNATMHDVPVSSVPSGTKVGTVTIIIMQNGSGACGGYGVATAPAMACAGI